MPAYRISLLASTPGKLIRLTLLLACLVVRPALAATSVDPALPADVAATVNGQPIPKHLVEIFLKNDREALGLTPKTDAERQQLAELPAAILDELVDRTLIAQGVRDRGIDPSGTALDADEQRLITFCGNEERYALYVAQNGFTRQEYRDNVLRTAARGQAMIAALTHDLTASDDEIAAFYDAHRADADLQWPERVEGAHILIDARPGVLSTQLENREGLTPDTPAMRDAITRETARLRERAEAVREEALLPGADFAALARKYSDDAGTRDHGGSLGTFAHGVHPPALDDAFFALRPGEIGPVVQTEYGFHVIRVAAHLPAGQRTLAEAAPEIRRRLLQSKSTRRLTDWLVDARAKAAIVIPDAHDLPAGR